MEQSATVMILAAARGQLNVVKYLAGGKGAVIGAKAYNGATALILAAANGQLDVVKYLADEKGADEKGAAIETKDCFCYGSLLRALLRFL